MSTITLIVFLFVIMTIFINIMRTEIKSQDCLGKTCYNTTPEASPDDKNSEALCKILETLKRNHTLVGWRRSLMISIVVCIPIIFILGLEWNVHNLVISIIVIFMITYASIIIFQNHWWVKKDKVVENSLLMLRGRF